LRQKAKIVYWNYQYGFLEINQERSIYFHKKHVSKKYLSKGVRLFDEVAFEVGITEKGKHKDKEYAHTVEFIQNGNYDEYERLIGKLIKWNGRKGYIDSPNLESKVLLYNTRITEVHPRKIKKGNYFIFHEVKSSKGGDQLFAFFAYPLTYEENIYFLKEKYKQSQVEDVKKHYQSLLIDKKGKSIESDFLYDLNTLEETQNGKNYQLLVGLVKSYQKKKYFPSWSKLKAVGISEVQLVNLWEDEVITSYDIEVLKIYFYGSTADKKRTLILNFDKESKLEILNYYKEKLIEDGKFSRLSVDLKTFLDIVYRRKDEASDNSFYFEIFNF